MVSRPIFGRTRLAVRRPSANTLERIRPEGIASFRSAVLPSVFGAPPLRARRSCPSESSSARKGRLPANFPLRDIVPRPARANRRKGTGILRPPIPRTIGRRSRSRCRRGPLSERWRSAGPASRTWPVNSRSGGTCSAAAALPCPATRSRSGSRPAIAPVGRRGSQGRVPGQAL